jgi:hypothetical protein
MKTNPVEVALQVIAQANGGILIPSVVVDAARPVESPLHSRFEWDDGKAAEEYRIWQARQLISVMVHVIGAKESEPERVWVSLEEDRLRKGGGYRALVDVLSDSDMRKRLLAQALKELENFQAKYSKLKELAGLFAAMKKVRRKAA